MSETELQQVQRFSNQRAEALERACAELYRLWAENAQLRQDRDRLDSLHRLILSEKNRLFAEVDVFKDFYKQEGSFNALKALIESAPKEWIGGLISVAVKRSILLGESKLGHAWEAVKLTESFWKREKGAFSELHPPLISDVKS